MHLRSGCVQCGDCLVIVVEPGLCSCVYERVTSLPQSVVSVHWLPRSSGRYSLYIEAGWYQVRGHE